MLKVRSAIAASIKLAGDPFEFDGLNQMVDAFSLSWPVQAWYRRLVRGVPEAELAHLRELTRRPLDVAALEALPKGSFGHEFIRFCGEHGLTPNGHVGAVPELVETFEKDWVTQRFFKIHDILHALVGFGTTVAEEMGLQVFDSVNLREPYGILATLGLPYILLFYREPRATFRAMARGYTLGRKAQNLFFAPLEEMWELDIDEVRARVGLATKGSSC